MTSFWGKLGGAAAGLALGGPLGALAGAIAGHFLLDRETDPAARAAREEEKRAFAFTMGVIALAAKMAKADGAVVCVEVQAFRRVFQIGEADLPRVTQVFDLAKRDVAGFEAYAAQLANLFRDEPATLEDVLHGLAHIAAADGAVHEAEAAYLAEVGRIFGLEPARLRRALGRHMQLAATDPYAVLGADPTASDDDLKRRHRALVAENHPDRALARGLPAEAVRIATDKLAAVNAAWDAIRAERKLA
ncbi:TerB family tellurite resistance protein [Methylopila henanensis]|uniref:TerB family tellurite resistance protein n=1 Tax=Methylopila henanensis TaxID=873516 RepID=A0ABW4K2C6_9HYPH